MSQLREWLAEAAPGYDRVGAAGRDGDPGVQILRFVRWMPDLIVMGAPGADRPERPLRRVPLVVVAPSECPALTVPAQRNLSLNDPVLLTHDGRPLPRPTADGE